MQVEVEVRLRGEIADPQGSVVARALRELGYDEVQSVRVGKSITLEVEADDPESAEARVREMCEQLLANPVMEDYRVRVLPNLRESRTAGGSLLTQEPPGGVEGVLT
ncbi:MAG: phosphoribosylformylglycinamidine synthase subunit PurS [Acidimicrobiia bacterium]